ncbi:MAG: hypothetical protein ACYC21_04665, partial [Eubacteriales bacterium]
MKRKYLPIIALILILLFAVWYPAYAITTRNYGWTLGTYDSKTKTFTTCSTVQYQGNPCRTLDWPVTVSGGTGGGLGQIIAFNDKTSSKNNGYPMVGDDKWIEWINFFQGDVDYVTETLRSESTTANIKTPCLEYHDFANFSRLAELCGGKGDTWSLENQSSTYTKTLRPLQNSYVNTTAVTPGTQVHFYINAQTYSIYGQKLFVTFQNLTDGTIYMN